MVLHTPETFKWLDHSKHAQVVTRLVHPCDWSLLPSTVFDTLTCAFATRVSHYVCLSIPEKPGSAAHSSTSTTSTGLLHLSVGALVHLVWQELRADACGCCHPSMSIAHHNYWHPWVGANWSHTAQNMSMSLPQLCGTLVVYNHWVRTSWNNSSVSHCTL